MSGKRWRSDPIGPHGYSVKLVEQASGRDVSLVFFVGGRRRQQRLGFSVRDSEGKIDRGQQARAIQAAHDFVSARMGGRTGQEPSDPTVVEVVRAFEREELPSLSEDRQEELDAQLECLRTYYGSLRPREFAPSDWQRLQRDRRHGRVDARGQTVPETQRVEVSDQTSAKELRTLRQICRWATGHRLPDGRRLLERDPTSANGCDLPKNENPLRPIADHAFVESLLEVAPQVHRMLRPLLVLSAETGRRRGALVALRWSDWSPDQGRYGELVWRADSDKLGKTWRTPVSPQARATLVEWKREQMRSGIRSQWIFPADHDRSRPVRGDVVGVWLRKAEERLRDHVPHWGWHSFRRLWATSHKHLSSKDAAYVGGWKNVATYQEVYAQPDAEAMEEIVTGGRKLQKVGDRR